MPGLAWTWDVKPNGKIIMVIVRFFVLITLCVAVLSGCEEPPSTTKPAAKPRSAAPAKTPSPHDNAGGAAQEEMPHGMSDPHGMINPHGNMPPMGAGGGAEATMENNGKLDLETLHWTVPKTWTRRSPRSGFILAEYGLPKAEGDKDDGRLTVSSAGGSIDDNVTRWRGQFGEKPDKEAKEAVDAGGVKVTLVDFSGTFHDSRGPMAPTVERPDYRMLGAIFEMGGQLYFIKAYGPSKTVAARADEIRSFIRSLKVDK
jgi:hypothetical protein